MEHFKIQNLSFSYSSSKERKSLDDVSLQIKKGEYVVLCGKSGSGKTTLLRHLKTVLTPYGKRSGEILFNGSLLNKLDARGQASKIGYVMQNPDDQIVTDKVWHELAFGLESLGCDQKTMRARVAEMACYFGIQDWFHKDVAILSGGQKQLLNLASIMAMHPEVLILDEPTSQLDPIAASDFLNTIRKINIELGTTVIITEHRLEDIFPYADRVIVMDNGKIIADDIPQNIGEILFRKNHPMFTAMPTPVRVFFQTGSEGACPLTVRDGRNWLNKEFEIVPKVTELNGTCLPEEVENPILTLKEVWFRYEKNAPDILRGVSMKVPRACLYAIVGGNGAGKSTTLKSICGICKPYRGKIKLYDNQVAMLPQDPKSLFVKKTVKEDLAEMTKDERKIEKMAKLCQITDLMDNHPYDLSGGEQQRAALAKVLLTEPEILLLDEPTKGIDGFFKEALAEILKELQLQGVTIVMVSHDVEFCAKYADRVSMFFDGQILTTNTPQQFFGSNSFYTTVANRMSRHVFTNAVTDENVVELFRINKGDI